MSFLDELERCSLSDAPSYIDFLYRYNPKKKQVFAFYEGDEDSSYYQFILRRIVGDDCEIEQIVAGCKNNVLKLQREFDWKTYNKQQIAFFVDRDLSFWLGDDEHYGENVFITDEYSIENYIANKSGFKAWIIHFEGFARAKKSEIELMITEYERIIEKFKKEMIPIMAEAVVAKRHDPTISLSDFKISKNKSVQFSIHGGHISFEICRDGSILEKWKLTDENTDEISKQKEQFITKISHYSVRGKWILCFMAELGEYMRLNSHCFAPSLGYCGKVPPTCSVSTSQCLSVLAPYCTEPIPPRLLNFLQNTYQTYLRNVS